MKSSLAWKMGLSICVLALSAMTGCKSNNADTHQQAQLVATQPTEQQMVMPVTPEPEPVASTPMMEENTVETDPAFVDQPMVDDATLAASKTKPAKSTAGKKAAADPSKRDRSLWYLVAASDKTHTKLLDTYAAYLSKKGVPMTVEKRGEHYAVLSAEGFKNATTAEAKALKAKVLSLGKAYSKTAVWQDAYFLPPAKAKKKAGK